MATSDNQSIYTIATGANNAFSFKKYNIMTNAWDTTPFLSGTSNQIRQATRPAVDPRTGLIYLTDTNYMNIFNLMTGAMESNLIPSNALTSRRFMGSVYNAARQSIMFYGGLGYNGTVDPQATYVTEYNIGLKTWGNFVRRSMVSLDRDDSQSKRIFDAILIVFSGQVANRPQVEPHQYLEPTFAWPQVRRDDFTLREEKTTSTVSCLTEPS